jgi:hypothetical protein
VNDAGFRGNLMPYNTANEIRTITEQPEKIPTSKIPEVSQRKNE